jgi:hypothetical protein
MYEYGLLCNGITFIQNRIRIRPVILQVKQAGGRRLYVCFRFGSQSCGRSHVLVGVASL